MSWCGAPEPDVSIVLPTYNEAETIIEVIDDVVAELSLEPYEFEVLVVDDDSPDGTATIVAREFIENDRVKVLRRVYDRGLSSAVLDGFRNSRGHYAIVMDADGQHPAEKLHAMIDTLANGARFDDDPGHNVDLVVGSRHVDGGSIEGWPRSRVLTSKGATLLARGFVPTARELTDPMSGFFGVDREVFDDDVLDLADPHGYKVLLELVALVPDAALDEVPITFRNRQAGESKLTLDEQLRFVEHVGGLALLSLGLDERVTPPQLIRAAEAAALTAIALPFLFLGIIIGDVDGAGGAALIAASGAAIALALARVFRTGESWRESRDRRVT